MSSIAKLLTLTSLSVLFVTIERFSFTTKVILQPYEFLRLHEVIQITLVILLTVIIPFLLLKEITNNFEKLKTRKGFILALIFIIGIYFYSTGNGIHELGSYIFNSYCPKNEFTEGYCKSSFFNDYYFGNILYFFGAYLFTLPLLLFELDNPLKKPITKKDKLIILANSLIYSFAIIAYSAFDRVIVGLIYTLITMITVQFLFLKIYKKYRHYPYLFYAVITYTIGGIFSLIVRMLR